MVNGRIYSKKGNKKEAYKTPHGLKPLFLWYYSVFCGTILFLVLAIIGVFMHDYALFVNRIVPQLYHKFNEKI